MDSFGWYFLSRTQVDKRVTCGWVPIWSISFNIKWYEWHLQHSTQKQYITWRFILVHSLPSNINVGFCMFAHMKCYGVHQLHICTSSYCPSIERIINLLCYSSKARAGAIIYMWSLNLTWIQHEYPFKILRNDFIVSCIHFH